MFLKAIDCFLAQHLQPSVLLLGQTYKPGVTALKMVTKWEAEKPYRNEPACVYWTLHPQRHYCMDFCTDG